MKTIIQRVSRANVKINDEITGKIDKGIVVFVGVTHKDTLADAISIAQKTANLRIFPDAQDRMNRSVLDIAGGALVISQFTLYADTRKGNRPSFVQAAAPDHAEKLYDAYTETLRAILGPDRVQTGRFRASMQVDLINDGPVTIQIATDPFTI
jgi:D-aminoacyl-tRNA deacylase